jgi:hypothetical protein
MIVTFNNIFYFIKNNENQTQNKVKHVKKTNLRIF